MIPLVSLLPVAFAAAELHAERVLRPGATDITRQLGPLVARTSQRVEHRETLGMGFFSLTVLRKPR